MDVAKAEMNSVLQSPGSTGSHVRRPSNLWLAGSGWFIACAASVTVAAAGMPFAGWSGDGAGVAPLAAVAGVQRTVAAIVRAGPAPRSDLRCQSCGIVERIRTLPFAGAAPAGYELTVRFRDGSRRISSHSDEAGWRVGDSIMLMGGARLADRI
jgi:hypothetical protein